MNVSPEQAATIARGALKNWERQGIPARDVAESVGVSGERITQFVQGHLATLEVSEWLKLAPVFDEFTQAEEAEERDYHLHPTGNPPRTTKTIIAETMSQ